jgi:hypothetical protein
VPGVAAGQTASTVAIVSTELAASGAVAAKGAAKATRTTAAEIRRVNPGILIIPRPHFRDTRSRFGRISAARRYPKCDAGLARAAPARSHALARRTASSLCPSLSLVIVRAAQLGSRIRESVRVRFGLLERVRFDVMPFDLTAPKGAPTADGQSLPRAASVSDLEADEFEAAYAAAWLPVFRFALAWTNDWSAAEDLAQEAFLRLWDRRADIDWSVPVLPWLRVTTRRTATDRFRCSGAPSDGRSTTSRGGLLPRRLIRRRDDQSLRSPRGQPQAQQSIANRSVHAHYGARPAPSWNSDVMPVGRSPIWPATTRITSSGSRVR